MAASRRVLLVGAGVAVVALPLVLLSLAVGVGWVEAFGDRWALGLTLVLLGTAVAWARRQGRGLLPVASAPPVRRSVGTLELIWSAELIAVGCYGLAAQWWVGRVLAFTADRLVLLPWAADALLLAGLGLLLAGWVASPRLLAVRRILHRDVTVQRRRVLAGALVVWSCFEGAGLLGLIVSCGTLSLLPFDLLGGGAIASLLAHRLLWFERLVDLVTHLPLVE